LFLSLPGLLELAFEASSFLQALNIKTPPVETGGNVVYLVAAFAFGDG